MHGYEEFFARDQYLDSVIVLAIVPRVYANWTALKDRFVDL